MCVCVDQTEKYTCTLAGTMLASWDPTVLKQKWGLNYCHRHYKAATQVFDAISITCAHLEKLVYTSIVVSVSAFTACMCSCVFVVSSKSERVSS